jgi:hypothetical protein
MRKTATRRRTASVGGANEGDGVYIDQMPEANMERFPFSTQVFVGYNSKFNEQFARILGEILPYVGCMEGSLPGPPTRQW